jgi:uncharacterized protein (TIGR03083 family)
VVIGVVVRTHVSLASVEAAADALLPASERVSQLLGQVADPNAHAIGIWSIAEVATHLSHSAGGFLSAAQGVADPREDLSTSDSRNIAAVAADPERDLARLAARIVAGERELAAYAHSVSDDPLVTAFEDVDIRLSALLGLELAELLVHGRDIARGSGQPWRIPAGEAVLALAGVVSMLPHMVVADRARGLTMTCDLSIRSGFDARAVLTDGQAEVVAASGAGPDCRLTADPVTLLLISYGRLGQTGALLRGRLLPWGRRPWLVARLMATLASV